jgi:hypothetical protein
LKNENAKIDPCLNWSTDMRDKSDTVGIGFTYKNLMSGRLDLLGDLLYTESRTDIGVSGGSYVNNPFALASPASPLGAGVPAVFFIPAASTPTAKNTLFEARLSGQYAIDRASAVRLTYWYQHLKSNDYIYDGLQFGSLTNVMPTNQQPFNYNVHVVGLSYVYRWQ